MRESVPEVNAAVGGCGDELMLAGVGGESPDIVQVTLHDHAELELQRAMQDEVTCCSY